MYARLVLSALLGLGSAVSAFALPTTELDLLEGRQTPSGSCATGVHIIASPGEGATTLSYLQSLVDEIIHYIPGSDYSMLPYPAPQNQTDGLRITTAGAKTLRLYIRQYKKACPHTKMVLAGYSAGGVINMNVLCGQSAPYPPKNPLKHLAGENIIASVVYGDESRTANTPYDLGTCKGVGVHPRANPAGCAAYQNLMQSYCDSPDPQCCQGGNDINAHFQYSKYDNQATYFVYQKYHGSA